MKETTFNLSHSGQVVYSTVLVTQTGPSPGLAQTSTNACGHVCMWIKKGSAAMLTSIQLAGVAPEVNLRITQVRKHTQKKGFTQALKPRADVTRSLKQGYQWLHKKGLCHPKIMKKNTFSSLRPHPILLARGL